MAITPLPTPPSRLAPSTFSTLADAFLGALPLFVTEANAQAAALDLNDTTATSTTSIEITVASKSLTVDASKSYQPGMSVKIARTASPSNWMHGDVTSYNSGTGALVVNVTGILGSGTYTDWTVTFSAPMNPANNIVLGSDADGDTYYRASGALARLAKGLTGALYGMNDAATLPAYKTLKVTDAGIMTNASQPAFIAELAAQSNVTGDGTVYNITGAIWTEIKDQAANFSNGTFTAPVTGTYLFTGAIICSELAAAHTYGNTLLITSNRSYSIFNGDVGEMAGTTALLNMPFSFVVDMDAADTVYLQIAVSNGTKVVDLIASTKFSGCLLF